MKTLSQPDDSFTLIEVLIFVTLISFIFITLSYLVSNALYSSKVSEHKIVATHYAEELREFLRGQKELDWSGFKSPVTAVGNVLSVCYAASPIAQSTGVGGTACAGNNCVTDPACSYSLGVSPNQIFKRHATLNFNDLGDFDTNNDRIEFNILVEWQEGGRSFSAPLDGLFSQLE